MNSVWSSFEAAATLLGWIAISTALVAAAERRATCGPVPPAWGIAAAAVAVAAAALGFRATPAAAIACGIACTSLVVAAAADARTGFLFDAITLPTALLVALLAIVSGTTASAAEGVLLLVGTFGAVVAFSRGRCMGLGDVKAMYVIGAAFGPMESLVAIFAACLSGLLTAAVQRRLQRGTEVRFGPHLAIGSTFALCAGGPIAHAMTLL